MINVESCAKNEGRACQGAGFWAGERAFRPPGLFMGKKEHDRSGLNGLLIDFL